MASVRPRKGSRYWYICYTTAEGKRVQRSSKLTQKAEAWALANAFERAAEQARARKWTEHRAMRFLQEIRAVVGGGNAAAVSVSEWFKTWLGSASRNLRPKTARKYSDTIAKWIEWLGPRAAGGLFEITAADIAAWRDSLLESGKAPTTINGDIGVVAQALGEAVARHLIERNPAEGMRLARAEKRAQRRESFTIEQARAILGAVNGEWRVFVAVLLFTGGRQQEAAQLRWENVDFEGGRVTLIRGKQNDQRHVLPLASPLRTELALAWRDSSSVFVCPLIAAMQVRAISNTFRRAILPRVGIVQPYGGREGIGRKLAAYGVHSFRHTLSTCLDQVGATESTRMHILGHEDPKVADRYTHADFTRSAAALEQAAALFSESAPSRVPSGGAG